MRRRLKLILISRRGFTLLELVVVIIIVGILAAVAVQKIGPLGDRIRTEETRQEMDRLAQAIAGNRLPDSHDGRIDFGYLGDIGALPPDLEVLIVNPGYATWRGPYIINDIEQNSDDYRRDAWQAEYIYTGGAVITSVGSGAPIIRYLAGSVDEFLSNTVSGNVYDADGTPPGPYRDSLLVRLIVPDGTGGLTARLAAPDKGGWFSFSGIPAGRHTLEVIYLPTADTLRYPITVAVGSGAYGTYRLTLNAWHASLLDWPGNGRNGEQYICPTGNRQGGGYG